MAKPKSSIARTWPLQGGCSRTRRVNRALDAGSRFEARALCFVLVGVLLLLAALLLSAV